MKRVYTWATDTASVLHFNTLLPYSALDPAEWECHWAYAPPANYRDYDVVVGQRLTGEATPWREICKDPNVLAVYSIDDDLTNVDPENTVPYRIYHPVREETIKNIAAADVVTVPTQAFADRMSKYNPETFILPICIPDGMVFWPDIRVPELTVGWSGSMFKHQDWPGVAEALAQYSYAAPSTRFHMIGHDYTRGLLAGKLRYDGWQDIVSSYRLYDFHIGIAPLADTYFNALKSRTKLVEYGARGIPTIASAVGEYTDWIEDGVNGLLVRETGDWFKHLLTLTREPELRIEMGLNAYEKACDAIISNNIHLWEEVWGRTK